MNFELGDTIICDEDMSYPKENLFIIGEGFEKVQGQYIERFQVVRRIDLKCMPFHGSENSVMNIRKDSHLIIKGVSPRVILLERKYV